MYNNCTILYCGTNENATVVASEENTGRIPTFPRYDGVLTDASEKHRVRCSFGIRVFSLRGHFGRFGDEDRTLKHGYWAAVSYVDAQIGKVLDEYRRLGLEKDTIVVLWSDHGRQSCDMS